MGRQELLWTVVFLRELLMTNRLVVVELVFDHLCCTMLQIQSESVFNSLACLPFKQTPGFNCKRNNILYLAAPRGSLLQQICCYNDFSIIRDQNSSSFSYS